MVGISKTEVGDSIALLLGELAALGVYQPDGTFVTSLADLRDRLVEMAATSEAACTDGLATRMQRPRSWANQKVLYDAKRHTHTAQGVVVSTIHGDLPWCDGGWPGPTTATRPPARPGRAVDRASGRRLVAAPLAWPAVPGRCRLPSRRRTDQPRPMAPSNPHLRSITETLNDARWSI